MNTLLTDLSASDKAFLLSLDLSNTTDCQKYCRWLTEQDRKRGMRCGIHYQEEDMDTSEQHLDSPLSSFKERYAAQRTREFADLRAASAAIEAASHDAAQTTTTPCDFPPDPYAPGLAALRAARGIAPTYATVGLRAAEIAEALRPQADPRYDPRGTPPDGYLIALAMRRVLDEEAGR